MTMPTNAFSEDSIKLSPVKPSTDHISLGGGLRGILFFIPFLISLLITATLIFSAFPPILAVVGEIIFAILWGTIISGIRICAAWEQAVVLRFGNYNSIKGPGIIYIVPIIDYAKFIDIRILTLHIPKQNVITKDNVPIAIDAVLFFQAEDPKKVIINIQDYRFAISQYAQNSLRDVVGGLSLDEVLSEREHIQQEICDHIAGKVTEWGMLVDSIRLQDIEMPEDLKRMMSRQASAEREKRATIIKAEGDKMAAESLAAAAKLMFESPGSMQLRSLQTVDSLGASPSNTVVLFPVDFVEILEHLQKKLGK